MAAMTTKKIINKLSSKLIPYRMWVQSIFLILWLGPFGLRLHNICSPVFHCYSCPLASFACPIGVLANFSALHLFPFIAVATLLLTGAFLGSLLCGWACPFGFLQDLIAKIPTPKFNLPQWAGHFRYLILIVMVLAVPYFFGEKHILFICRLCPVGALEGAMPNVAKQAFTNSKILWPCTIKLTILVLLLVAMFFVRRPWCRLLCPLGAIFGLFNRLSAFFLRLDPQKCNDCQLCHKLCGYDIKPQINQDSSQCIRCFECTKCSTQALTFSNIFKRQ